MFFGAGPASSRQWKCSRGPKTYGMDVVATEILREKEIIEAIAGLYSK